MKKFYEAPAVEFTGFSAEDVITTSAVITEINSTAAGFNANEFSAAVAQKYGVSTSNVKTFEYGSYQW